MQGCQGRGRTPTELAGERVDGPGEAGLTMGFGTGAAVDMCGVRRPSGRRTAAWDPIGRNLAVVGSILVMIVRRYLVVFVLLAVSCGQSGTHTAPGTVSGTNSLGSAPSSISSMQETLGWAMSLTYIAKALHTS